MGVTRAVNVSHENLPQVMTELGMTERFDVGLEISGVPAGFCATLDVMNPPCLNGDQLESGDLQGAVY
ncbi:putative l-threonine 3-dehydrogenase [Candidatus Erwinia dacicola]|uniref:L-threonine 3-dehydrogenase n=1 Tax=Candidatus Erwinia dacicola TaxID=252393 RepID=A0A328TN27_9GAMM|nr:putative l-threonine 3-dehydrogenase [Candidatus Erwinia dacicola]